MVVVPNVDLGIALERRTRLFHRGLQTGDLSGVGHPDPLKHKNRCERDATEPC